MLSHLQGSVYVTLTYGDTDLLTPWQTKRPFDTLTRVDMNVPEMVDTSSEAVPCNRAQT